MTTIINKKKRPAVNLAAVVTLPAYKTRDIARTVATRLRERGVTPTTPVKGADGWRVTAKHSGGTLHLSR